MHLGIFVPTKEAKSSALRLEVGEHVRLCLKGIRSEGILGQGDLWPALDAFPGVHIVGLIHDEILLEVPRDLVDQVREIALASMTSKKLQKQYLGDIPLEADCNVAETWGDAH